MSDSNRTLFTEFLLCPACGVELEDVTGGLQCALCAEVYPLRETIPIVVRDAALRKELLCVDVPDLGDTLPSLVSRLRFSRRGGCRHPANPELPDQFRAAKQGAYWRHLRDRRQYILDEVHSCLSHSETARSADLGCGDGVGLASLRSAGPASLLGFDYSIISLVRARRMLDNSILLVQGDLRERCFQDGVFDVIICTQTLMLLEDDVAVLRLLRRMLHPDGTLILGVPHTNSWIGRIRNYVLQPYLWLVQNEVQFYDESSLRARLDAAGFVVRKLHRMGWEFPVTFIDRWLHRPAVTDALGEWLFTHVRWLNANSPQLFAVCRKA